MKGIIIFVLLVWSALVWADPETYSSRLESIGALAGAKRCYTLQQGTGLTSVEFARLRAICWKAQLGDDWAAKNPVYGSQTLSKLEKPLSAEEKAAAAEKARKEQKARDAASALAAQERACLDIGILTVQWNAETKSCDCRQAGYILKDKQCISPAAARLAQIRHLCEEAGPETLWVPDPNAPTLMAYCGPAEPVRTPAQSYNLCHTQSQRIPHFDLGELGLPPQPTDSHCIVNLQRDLLGRYNLEPDHREPPIDPALRAYLDSITINH